MVALAEVPPTPGSSAVRGLPPGWSSLTCRTSSGTCSTSSRTPSTNSRRSRSVTDSRQPGPTPCPPGTDTATDRLWDADEFRARHLDSYMQRCIAWCEAAEPPTARLTVPTDALRTELSRLLTQARTALGTASAEGAGDAAA